MLNTKLNCYTTPFRCCLSKESRVNLRNEKSKERRDEDYYCFTRHRTATISEVWQHLNLLCCRTKILLGHLSDILLYSDSELLPLMASLISTTTISWIIISMSCQSQRQPAWRGGKSASSLNWYISSDLHICTQNIMRASLARIYFLRIRKP